MYYFLGDGIYPHWPIIALPITGSNVKSEQKYSFNQESVRKDVERLFGILQSRFEILRRESRRWDLSETIRISNVCVILHNIITRMSQYQKENLQVAVSSDLEHIMTVEFRRMDVSAMEWEQNLLRTEMVQNSNGVDVGDVALLRDMRYTDVEEHCRLQKDLVNHKECTERCEN